MHTVTHIAVHFVHIALRRQFDVFLKEYAVKTASQKTKYSRTHARDARYVRDALRTLCTLRRLGTVRTLRTHHQ
jgi:hypothetical protein